MSARVVRQSELSKQHYRLAEQIEEALTNRWLDGAMAHELRRDFENAMDSRDLKRLEAVLKKIQVEICWRQRTTSWGMRYRGLDS